MNWQGLIEALVSAMRRIADPIIAWFAGKEVGREEVTETVEAAVKAQQEAQDGIDQDFDGLARDHSVRQRLRDALAQADSADRDGKL